MLFYYKRYKEKGLYYFIDTTTRYYIGYITIKAKYSLFILEEE